MRIRSFRFTLFLILGLLVLASVPASALRAPIEKPVVPDFDDEFFIGGDGPDQLGGGQLEQEAEAANATPSWSDSMLRDLRELKLALRLTWKAWNLP